MRENVEQMRQRTKAFALRVVHMYATLPRTRLAYVLGDQALRSGTSVGAQYREACRSRSNAELISKLESTLQEVDETAYWLEMLVDSEVVPALRLDALQNEADELTAMLVAAVRAVKRRPR